ncbi:MAG: hypothetical protein Q7S93_14075 [Phenylobacterium sp.]|nr:hypothetical protein [Phenylobacterium sp.]
MLTLASSTRKILGALCLSLCALSVAAEAADNTKPASRSTLGLNALEAGELLLRDVCLPAILEQKSIGKLAISVGGLSVAANLYGAGRDDKAYRLGPITTAVYVIDWADGSCTTRVNRGDAEMLRGMAERTILARPEAFVRGSHRLEDSGRVMRTVYCAQSGPERLVASITTPGPVTRRGTPALSSTVYRAQGASALCAATSADQSSTD